MWMYLLQVQLFLMSHFGEDVFVCAHPAIGAGFSTMCFSTVFLVINTFTGIMTHELETVLYINYTNTDILR